MELLFRHMDRVLTRVTLNYWCDNMSFNTKQTSSESILVSRENYHLACSSSAHAPHSGDCPIILSGRLFEKYVSMYAVTPPRVSCSYEWVATGLRDTMKSWLM